MKQSIKKVLYLIGIISLTTHYSYSFDAGAESGAEQEQTAQEEQPSWFRSVPTMLGRFRTVASGVTIVAGKARETFVQLNEAVVEMRRLSAALSIVENQQEKAFLVTAMIDQTVITLGLISEFVLALSSEIVKPMNTNVYKLIQAISNDLSTIQKTLRKMNSSVGDMIGLPPALPLRPVPLPSVP